MKNLIPVIFLFLLTFQLPAQNQIDRKAATMDIIMGFTEEFKDIEKNKNLFSPNLRIIWPAGNVWPDGSEGSLEQWWSFFLQVKANGKHEISDVVVKELGDETYAFLNWKHTILKNENNPEVVGKTAQVPGAYRMIWEGNKIKEWHIFYDNESRNKQFGLAKE